MDIDVTALLGATHREVTTGERDGAPVAVVRATRTYDTGLEDLWDAITSAERIPRWFLPISGELRVGGRYQLEGNAGGEVLTCDPPHHLAVTWEFGGGVTWVEVHLEADPAGGTRLRLEHTAPADVEHWGQFGPGAVGIGWELGLMGLGLHLEAGGAPVDQAEANAWTMSADGLDFMARSSDGWRDADIAGGTPVEVATERADRTTAAYRGDPG